MMLYIFQNLQVTEIQLNMAWAKKMVYKTGLYNRKFRGNLAAVTSESRGSYNIIKMH